METYRLPLSNGQSGILFGSSTQGEPGAASLGQGSNSIPSLYQVSSGRLTGELELLREGFNNTISGLLESIKLWYKLDSVNPPYNGTPGGPIISIIFEIWQSPYGGTDSSYDNLVYSFNLELVDGTDIYELEVLPNLPLSKSRLLVLGKTKTINSIFVSGLLDITLVVRP